MRQGAASGQSVIKAVASNADGTILTGLTIIAYATSGQIIERIDAQSATLESGAWVLRGVKRWDLQSQNPERDATVTDGPLRFPTNLTPDRIREGLGSARILSFWKLPSFITSLESAGFSARSQRLWLQIELAMPLLLAAMVLIAAGFTMRPARFGKTGTMVMYALLGGFFIFFLRNFAQVLGENGQIPVYLAAWSPPIAAIMLALALLLHLEDG
jgi:lipopolysaccharide export system permease protein